MNTHFGKPKKCDHCGTTDTEKHYDWANVDHKYRRRREDFKRLCRSCHLRYDWNPSRHKQATKNLYWNTGASVNHVRGENHGNAKLTKDQALYIKYKKDMTNEEKKVIMKEFGICRQTVNLIRRGISWGHI
jgi:hypothetical protein